MKKTRKVASPQKTARAQKTAHAARKFKGKSEVWRKGQSAVFWAGISGWRPVKIYAVTIAGNPQIVHPMTGKLMVVERRSRGSWKLAKPSPKRYWP